ncbi:MAG: hypothetical protein LBT55_01670 [Clostridiaceae bacterium]|jgi:DNA-directed RNA polymerase specialized sigma subunit|nr:hypothetical protein [Clostridiaceae bacterium]
MQRNRKYNEENINAKACELAMYKELAQVASECRERANEYREKYTDLRAVDYTMTKVQGGDGAGFVDMVIRWVDLEETAHKAEYEAEQLLWSIKDRLAKLNHTQARILEYYYIKGYSVVHIARIMDYSEARIRQLKYAGLQNY